MATLTSLGREVPRGGPYDLSLAGKPPPGGFSLSARIMPLGVAWGRAPPYDRCHPGEVVGEDTTALGTGGLHPSGHESHLRVAFLCPRFCASIFWRQEYPYRLYANKSDNRCHHPLQGVPSFRKMDPVGCTARHLRRPNRLKVLYIHTVLDILTASTSKGTRHPLHQSLSGLVIHSFAAFRAAFLLPDGQNLGKEKGPQMGPLSYQIS